MSSVPVGSADITEFMFADAGHVVAALKLIDKRAASGTLSVAECLFEELQLKSVAVSTVNRKQAPTAKLS